jgi:hypothetical protein
MESNLSRVLGFYTTILLDYWEDERGLEGERDLGEGSFSFPDGGLSNTIDTFCEDADGYNWA